MGQDVNTLSREELETEVRRLRSGRDRFETLLHEIETAFAIVQVKFDADERAVDYRFVEANPAFEQQAGVNLRGRWVSEFAPNLERFWFDTYGHVARTGEPANFESFAQNFERWFDVRAVRIGDPAERQIAIFFNDTTARRLAEEKLRVSEAAARGDAERVQLALAAGAIIGTWFWDLPTDRFTIDEAFARSFGLDPALGREGIPLAQIVATVHPDDQAGLAAAINEAVERGGGYAHQYRTRRTDGKYYWLEANGHVDHEKDGTPLKFSGVLIDIANRRADTMLSKLAERLRTLETPQAMALAAAETVGITLCLSRAAYGNVDDVGRHIVIEQDWLAESQRSIAGEHDFNDYGSYIEALRRGENVVINDVTADPRTAPQVENFSAIDVGSLVNLPLMDGKQLKVVFCLNHSRPHAWSADELTFARRVMERTEVEIARREAEERLRALNVSLEEQVFERTRELDRAWRLSSELLVIARQDGTLEAVNPAWTKGLGWEPLDIIDTPFMDYTHPDDIAETMKVFGHILQSPLTVPYEYRFRHKDGSYRWIAWTGVFEGDRVYASGRDLTRERETEQALRQSQKMEAVGQLTGGLAHDFNNLLAGISGSLELMQTRLSQGRFGDLDRYITVAQGAAKRAAALTHRLLAFSRRQTLDPKPTNVNRLIDGMEELIQRTIGPQIKLEIVGAAGLWPALIDPSQLENALLNLCINARDAMPEGGRITIETANRWLDRPAATTHAIPEGQYLSICVTDTGSGMSPEVIAKVFEPFFTTKPIGQGTGLGLSMIHGFAQQSGGQVRIYSEVDQGTTVCLYLPRHYGDTGSDEVALKLAEVAHAGQDETVLIVDDEPSVRLLVTEVLEDLGYIAIEAADSMAGLKVLQSDVRIDLLVTDVGLPGGMNGRQMADAGRERRRDLKVLFITGYAENAVVGNGHLEPGMQVLTKPFAMEALASRIKDLITSR